MDDHKLTDGALMAYLDGEPSEAIAKLIEASPELIQRLDELRQVDTLLHQNLGAMDLPDPQDMVDVVSGQATPMQRLIVAAYVRDSVRGQREMAELESEFAQEGGAVPVPATNKKSRLPLFTATPLTSGAGLRSSTVDAAQQTFQVAELQAQVTLRIVPPAREIWQLEGYVTQNFSPLADAKITLRSDQSRPRPRQTDQDGFFAFRQLAEGKYQMRVHLKEGILVVPILDLIDEYV